MKLSEFNEIVKKRPQEPFWISRYFWRHITIPSSWVCARLGISADAVTVVSLVAGLAGGICYCWPTPLMYLLGTLLIQFWWMLDHMDGELARYEIKFLKKKPSLAGPYLDLLVHRWVQPLYHICMGIGMLRVTGDWWYVLLGTVAGANFVGFTRTQAECMALAGLANGQIDRNNADLAQLMEVGRAVPSEEEKASGGIRQLVAFAKSMKTYFSFPGCLVMLCFVVAIDGFYFKFSFPQYYGIACGAVVAYLALQAAIALLQNVAGTWYVTTILRRLP
jgi:hypothetical protein